jgi:hypothetical protein
MVNNHIKRKRLKFVLLSYLILALIGSSAISAGEAFCFEYSNNDSICSGRYFSSISHIVDWLAGDVLTIRKTSGYSNSPLRNRLLRLFALAGTTAAAIYLAGANSKTIKNDNIPIMKNLVLLKLRI